MFYSFNGFPMFSRESESGKLNFILKKMISNYEICIYVFDESEYYNPFIGWRRLEHIDYSIIVYYFDINGNIDHEYEYQFISEIAFKGYVSIYQYKDIEIVIPNNKIICSPNFPFLTYNSNIEFQIILFLFSSSYKNYLILSEFFFIK